MKTSPNEVTGLLLDWSNGDRSARDKLVPLVHDELRRLAHHHGPERKVQTVQNSARYTEHTIASSIRRLAREQLNEA